MDGYTGAQQLARGQTLDDAGILRMNYLVDGVSTRLPH